MMKLRVFTSAILIITIITSFSSCKSKSGDYSSKTGVRYNDPANGGVQIKRKIKETPGPGLIPIEGGTLVMGGSVSDEIAYNYDVVKRRVTGPSVYTDGTERATADWLGHLQCSTQHS